MDLDIQWFIYKVIDEKFITQQECDILLSKSSGNLDINSFGQETFDIASKQMDEINAELLLEQMEKILIASKEQARLRISPPERHSKKENNGVPCFSNISVMDDEQLKSFLRKLLQDYRNNNSSDLHFSTNTAPFARHLLEIVEVEDYILTAEDAFRINTIFLTEEQAACFTNNNNLTYALAFSKNERYRVALMSHKDGIAGTYHLLSSYMRTLDELGFNSKNAKTISNLLDHHNGLILITGPIGSGKTTTLASMVNIMNKKRHDHIIMIEDPIEIVQSSRNCNITQREIVTHTESYARAIKGALREDPDVIVIGELNDLKTIEIAITASETGHLVIGTLPTGDTINTLNRIVDVFPPSQQPQIRAMISGSLRGVICQKLIPGISGKTTVACEILVNNLAVSNTISEGKHHLLKPILQTGSKLGMCTMDESLFELYKDKVISGKTALDNIKNQINYKDKIVVETLK